MFYKLIASGKTKEVLGTGAKKIKWDLTELFKGTDAEFNALCQKTIAAAQSHAAKYKGKTSEMSVEKLVVMFKKETELMHDFELLGLQVFLQFSTNTAEESTLQRKAQIEKTEVEISNLLMFSDLELGQISTEAFKKIDKPDVFGPYYYDLQRIRKNASHQLSEKEEQLANKKDLSGVSKFDQLYEKLTSSFKYKFELEGKAQEMSGDQLRSLRMHPDKSVRRRAMKAFYEQYQIHKITIAETYNAIMLNGLTESEIRGFNSVISRRNLANKVGDKAVHVLNQVTNESYELVHKYYAIKKELLDMPDMTLADIYAPLPSVEINYSWQQAQEMVLENFQNIHPRFYTLAKQIFDQQHIDASNTKNRSGGAYCATVVPDSNPYVFIGSYDGKFNDVSTVAHEVGHACHGMLASKANPEHIHASLAIAETASTFSEMMLADMALAKEKNIDVKISIISGLLEHIFASSHRQNMFNNFELRAHELMKREGSVSSEKLCRIYKEELQRMFGDAVEIPDEYQWEWSTIPHFFSTPFYVYAYNFANFMTISLYQKVKDNPEFAENYIHFLEMGGSADVEEIAASVGIDVNDPKFWRSGTQYIERLTNQLEKLIQEKAKLGCVK